MGSAKNKRKKPEADFMKGVDDATKEKLATCARKIKAATLQEMETIFVRGDELRKAQALLANHKNGTFQWWVKNRCQMSRQTAYRFIRAAEAVTAKYRPTVARYFSAKAIYELTDRNVPAQALEEAIKTAGPDKRIGPKEAKELLRRKMVEDRKREVVELPEKIRLECCDLREIDAKLGLAPASVDGLFSDPLYGEADLWQYEEIARLAARVLRPGGWCLVYAGKMYLDRIHATMRNHLTYTFQFDVLHAKPTLIESLQIQQGAKYIIGYRFQPTKPWWYPFSDRLEFEPEKGAGKWQQPIGEAVYLLENLCPRGGVVLDPMVGTGTTAVACLRLSLKFVGGDLDPAMISTTERRVAEEMEKVVAVEPSDLEANAHSEISGPPQNGQPNWVPLSKHKFPGGRAALGF